MSGLRWSSPPSRSRQSLHLPLPLCPIPTRRSIHYVLHAFLAAFGYGVFQARFLSLLFGVLAILMIYLLGDALFDSATGLLAARPDGATSILPNPLVLIPERAEFVQQRQVVRH